NAPPSAIASPPATTHVPYNSLPSDTAHTGSSLEASPLPLDTAQHLGDGMLRGIALKPTDGVVRGQSVTASGAPISVPVGDVTLGTVFDVVGNPLNKPAEQLEITERWPIHRKAPNFDQLESSTVMFETGIKSID